MAANLQSFQSNDKQMQAIRELTNEVFNLKQKELTDITALDGKIDDQIAELKAELPIKFLYVTGGTLEALEFDITFDEAYELLTKGYALYMFFSGNILSLHINNTSKMEFYAFNPNLVTDDTLRMYYYNVVFNKTGNSYLQYNYFTIAITPVA